MNHPRLFSVALLIALVGCSDDTESATPAPTQTPAQTGTISLTFAVSSGVRKSPNLKSPLKGVVYGSLYKKEDVSLTGPSKDAKEIAPVELADVDLQTDTTSKATWKSPAIDPGTYVFLGFYDVNANGATSKNPDSGDPVTLPVTNEFTIEIGKQTELTATFDLVFN